MLTEEAIKILSAPVPKSEIKTKSIQGNTIRFTDVQFVENRLSAADPSYGKMVELGPKGIIVTLTVLGVARAGSADVVDVKGFGSPVKNAEAQALKRAAKSFGVAAELWDKDEDAHDGYAQGGNDDEAPRNKPAYSNNNASKSSYSGNNAGKSTQSGGGGNGPSEAQIKFLMGDAFSVPPKVAKALPDRRTASSLIEGLKDVQAGLDDEDAYDENPKKYIAKVLKNIAPKLIALLNESDSDDEDNDAD